MKPVLVVLVALFVLLVPGRAFACDPGDRAFHSMCIHSERRLETPEHVGFAEFQTLYNYATGTKKILWAGFGKITMALPSHWIYVTYRPIPLYGPWQNESGYFDWNGTRYVAR